MPADGKVIPVRVAVRSRPLIAKETNEGCTSCIQFVPGEPQLLLGTNKAFTFDYVFPPSVSNETVYEEACRSLVESIFKGYNATVLAYGQTGSGKTFSMGGSYDLDDTASEEIVGIIPRVIKDVFQGIQQRPDFQYHVKVSYIELYIEELLDLLVPAEKREKDGVVIREDVGGGVKLVGQVEREVTTMEETMQQLEIGARGRTTGSTAMNNASSRSHAIFTIHIERTNKQDSHDFCRSKFHLVDLAGSERQKKTRAEGDRFKEGVNINKGLLSLGNVISALGEEHSKRGHIPYRDSKLTRLLQDSLGGNSHTLMIACVSPADSNMEETISTLRYADRARKIKNKPIINQDPQAAEILRLRQLVQQLQTQVVPSAILNASKSEPSEVTTKDIQDLRKKNKELEAEIATLTTELHASIDQNAELCEKVIIAEAARDAFKQKLELLKEKNKLHLTHLNKSLNIQEDAEVREQLNVAEEMQKTIMELEELGDNDDSECEPVDTSCGPASNNTEVEEVQKEFTMKRAKLGRELQELNKVLQKKEWLAKQMTENDTQMSAMKAEYEGTMKKLEGDIQSLQQEKENLVGQLQSAKHNPASSKVSEQRRKRLKELENEMGQLKKKMVEQSKMLKLKDQTDKQCTKLDNEIKAMKQARVRLIKQMKEEAEGFRKWKQEKDKEVLQLKAKDRKRQVEMVKMEQKFSRQEAVLRRKAEQAEAAQKRLKEIVGRQKAARDDKQNQDQKLPMKERLRKWLQEDIELQVSLDELRGHKEGLVKHRSQISQKVTQLKAKLEKPSYKKKRLNNSRTQETEEREAVMKQIKELETEMDCCSAQIADIQQKLMDADQGDKGRTRWMGIHSLVDAKTVMQQLFKSTVSAKVDISKKSGEVEELRSNYQEATQAAEDGEQRAKVLEQQHNEDLDTMRRQYEDKILYLLTQLNRKNQVETGQGDVDDNLQKQLKFQEQAIEQMVDVKDALEKKNSECADLQKELTVIKFQNRTGHRQLMPDFDTPSTSFFTPPVAKTRRAIKRKSQPEEGQDEEFKGEDDDDDEKCNDPDWKRGSTPYFHADKSKNFTSVANPQSQHRSGGSSSSVADVATRLPSLSSCGCTGNCGTKRCSCQKNSISCSDGCRCLAERCSNREVDVPESTTEGYDFPESSSLENSAEEETPSTLNATFVKDSSISEAESSGILQECSNNPSPRVGLFRHPEQTELLETSGVKKRRKLHNPKKYFDGLR